MVFLPLLNFRNILLFLSNTFLRGMIFQIQTLLSSLMLDSKLLKSKACVFLQSLSPGPAQRLTKYMPPQKASKQLLED